MKRFEVNYKENNTTRESDRSENPAMHHRLVRCSLFYFQTHGASLIEAESAFRVARWWSDP